MKMATFTLAATLLHNLKQLRLFRHFQRTDLTGRNTVLVYIKLAIQYLSDPIGQKYMRGYEGAHCGAIMS